MSSRFNYCSSLTSLNLLNFNITNVTNMNYIFSFCYSLTSLNLLNFNTINITKMYNMFTKVDKKCEIISNNKRVINSLNKYLKYLKKFI